MAIPLRHENKFFITRTQYLSLRSVLKAALNPDPHTNENGQYHIRSLYFDTVFNDAYVDKLNGVQDREKYRMRIYNFSDREIFMECKSKFGSFISKRSVQIPRDLADQLIAGDPSDLENTSSGLLRDVYKEMRTRLLRPVVIVDYLREPYLHPAEEVRITFDMQLRTGLNSIDIFNPDVPTVPPLSHDEIILEIKYNRVLPPYIRDLISSACPQPVQTAISKYTLCRRFENMEA